MQGCSAELVSLNPHLMTSRTFCIHGHFYQPTREDPLTGLIPTEPGAAPYANWNERINAECYRPNAELGNFEHISFNIGPTLFSWMAIHDPVTYNRIITQTQANFTRYGVGNAMAQGYHHTILPLASATDKNIQVYWGITDFESRFGRKPQGMWLPETAVDNATLTVLAHNGIEFTILAPWQANEQGLDYTKPYRVVLPDGKNITVFLYHGELSGGVSFNSELTADADRFATNNLIRYFRPDQGRASEEQMLLLASDGELYGHHKPFREQFLARLLNGASVHAGLTPTYPALWLKDHPAREYITIREYTSWSCHHGVARWSGECGCTPGAGSWKTPLRRSLDNLAAALDSLYLDAVYSEISKPRVLREQYIHVLLGKITADELINEMANQVLTTEQIQRIKILLRAQNERQRMFASCGWYHEDFDRIEPKNSLAYAAQAICLTHIATGEDLAPWVFADIKHVVSTRTGLRAESVFQAQLERAYEKCERGSHR